MTRLAALSDAVREFKGDGLTACLECRHRERIGEWDCCTCDKITETVDVMRGVSRPVVPGHPPPCVWVSNGHCGEWEAIDG